MDSQPANPRMIRASTAAQYGVILFLTQLLFSTWTVRAAGNRDVIDYISFAGTLTSMLLAVLAIVYSYYTTTSQKFDADRIAGQIGSLSGTVQTLNNSESRLTDELERLSDIRTQLKEVSMRVEQSGETSSRMQVILEGLRESYESGREAQRSAASALRAEKDEDHATDPEFEVKANAYFAARIASSATADQVLMLYAAFINDIVNDEPIRETISREVEPFLRTSKDSSFVLDTNSGELFAYTMIFVDLEMAWEPSVRQAFVASLKARVTNEKMGLKGSNTLDWGRLAPHLVAKISELQ